MNTQPLKWASNISTEPQKQPHITEKDWEPYIPLIIKMRDHKPKKTAKEIHNALANQGFHVNFVSLKKKLRRLRPLNVMKRENPIQHQPQLPEQPPVVICLADTEHQAIINEEKEKEWVFSSDVEMIDVPSEPRDDEEHNPRPNNGTVPHFSLTKSHLNNEGNGSDAQEPIYDNTDNDTDEEINVTELLAGLNLDSRMDQNDSSAMLENQTDGLKEDAPTSAPDEYQRFKSTHEDIIKGLSATDSVTTYQDQFPETTRFQSWLRENFHGGQDLENFSAEAYFQQNFPMERLLKMVADVKYYDPVETESLNYQRCFEQYLEESNDYERDLAIRLHNKVAQLGNLYLSGYRACGLSFMLEEIHKGTRVDSPYQKYLQAIMHSFWAESRLRHGCDVTEYIEINLTASNLYSDIYSTPDWNCISAICCEFYYQDEHLYELLLSNYILSYVDFPGVPLDIDQAGAIIEVLRRLGERLIGLGFLDDASNFFENLIKNLKSNSLLEKLRNIRGHISAIHHNLSEIKDRQGLHGKSLATLNFLYKSTLLRQGGKEDYTTLTLLESMVERLLFMENCKAALKLLLYLSSFLTLENLKFLMMDYNFVTVRIGNIYSLIGDQVQALKWYGKAASPFHSAVRRLSLSDTGWLEMLIAEAWYKRGLVLYAQPLAERAVEKFERLYGTDTTEQEIIWEAYATLFRINPFFACRATPLPPFQGGRILGEIVDYGI